MAASMMMACVSTAAIESAVGARVVVSVMYGVFGLKRWGHWLGR
jgi:hypothetical protein